MNSKKNNRDVKSNYADHGGLMSQITALTSPPVFERSTGRNTEKPLHPYYKKPGRGHNRDNCDACGGGGDIICCDTCCASFHLICLDPPLEEKDLPIGAWKCWACRVKESKAKARRNKNVVTKTVKVPHKSKYEEMREEILAKRLKPDNKDRAELLKKHNLDPNKPLSEDEKAIKSFFTDLIIESRNKNPVEFKLPKEYGCYDRHFPGGSRPLKKTANFTPKITFIDSNENGTNSRPSAFCFDCTKSSRAGPLLKCDYCPQYYHLDCLTPPLTVPPTTMWICPLHPEPYAEHKLLKTSQLSERLKIWDQASKPIDQGMVKLNFLKKVARKNPCFRTKQPVDRINSLRVPDVVKEIYSKCNTKVPEVPSGFEGLYKDYTDFMTINSKEYGVSNYEDWKGPAKDQIFNIPKSSLDMLAVACEIESYDHTDTFYDELLSGLSMKTIKKLAGQRILEITMPMNGKKRRETMETSVLKAEVSKERTETPKKIEIDMDMDIDMNNGNGEEEFEIAADIEELQREIRRVPLEENQHKYLQQNQVVMARQLVMANPMLSLVCMNTETRIKFSNRTITIGTGSDMDFNLTRYVQCPRISRHHATIFYNRAIDEWELLNYSKDGTFVDSVLYGCDRNIRRDEGSEDDDFMKNFKEIVDKKRGAVEKSQKILSSFDPLEPPIFNGFSCFCIKYQDKYDDFKKSWEGSTNLKLNSVIKIGCLTFYVEKMEVKEEKAYVQQVNKSIGSSKKKKSQHPRHQHEKKKKKELKEAREEEEGTSFKFNSNVSSSSKKRRGNEENHQVRLALAKSFEEEEEESEVIQLRKKIQKFAKVPSIPKRRGRGGRVGVGRRVSVGRGGGGSRSLVNNGTQSEGKRGRKRKLTTVQEEDEDVIELEMDNENEESLLMVQDIKTEPIEFEEEEEVEENLEEVEVDEEVEVEAEEEEVEAEAKITELADGDGEGENSHNSTIELDTTLEDDEEEVEESVKESESAILEVDSLDPEMPIIEKIENESAEVEVDLMDSNPESEPEPMSLPIQMVVMEEDIPSGSG